MDLNFIFFPVPNKKFSVKQHKGELIWVPVLAFTELKGTQGSLFKENLIERKVSTEINKKMEEKKRNSRSYDVTLENNKCQPKRLSSGKKVPYFGSVLKTRAEFCIGHISKREINIDLNQSQQMKDKEEKGEDFIKVQQDQNLINKQQLINNVPKKRIEEWLKKSSIDNQNNIIEKSLELEDSSFMSNNTTIIDEIDEHQKINLKKNELAPQIPSRIQNYVTKQFQHNIFSTSKIFPKKVPFQQNKMTFNTNSNFHQSLPTPSSSFGHNLYSQKQNNEKTADALKSEQQTFSFSQNIKSNNLTQSANLPQQFNEFNTNKTQIFKLNYNQSSSPFNSSPIMNDEHITTSISIQSQNDILFGNNLKTNSNISSNQVNCYEKISNNQDYFQEKKSYISQINNSNYVKNNQNSLYQSLNFSTNPANDSFIPIQIETPTLFNSCNTTISRPLNIKQQQQDLSYSTTQQYQQKEPLQFIPCLYLKSKIPSNYLIIYFHGNGEDISLSYELTNHIRKALYANLLVVEYRGYGIYEGKTDDECILQDAEHIYNYFTRILKYLPENILVFGRSIGTGPATWLAANYKVRCLILISPFTSLRGIVKHIVGTIAQHLVKERFVNQENIKKVQCPTFIVHGQKDSLIPWVQSQILHGNYFN